MTTTAPRLAPLPMEQWTEEQRVMLRGRMPSVDRFLADDGSAPRLPNILGLFAHHPQITGPWLAMSSQMTDASQLADRDRELVILRVSARTACAYEWGQHARMGLAAGLTDRELAAVGRALPDGGWSERDTALLTATDQLIDAHRIDDATWALLNTHLDRAQTLELLFVVGSYVALACVLNSVGLPPDPGSDAALPAQNSTEV